MRERGSEPATEAIGERINKFERPWRGRRVSDSARPWTLPPAGFFKARRTSNGGRGDSHESTGLVMRL